MYANLHMRLLTPSLIGYCIMRLTHRLTRDYSDQVDILALHTQRRLIF